jgi:hypothetical protein
MSVINDMRTFLHIATLALALGALGQAQSGKGSEAGKGKGSGKGKAAASAAPAGPIPRGADGKPNFSGIFSTVQGVRERQEPISFQPSMEKKNAEFVARQRIDEPTSRCLSAGIIRLTSTAFFPIQFVQTPDQMVVLYEWDHFFRVIPTDGRPQVKDPDPPQSLGHSVGRWDGDALIVDVVGLSDYTWIDSNAGIHSDALHIVETYRMLDADTIRYEAVLDDVKAWTKPWHFGATLKRRPANDKLLEYNCAENNKPDDYVQGK